MVRENKQEKECMKIILLRQITDVIESGRAFWKRIEVEEEEGIIKKIISGVLDKSIGNVADDELFELDLFNKGEIWRVTFEKLDNDEIREIIEKMKREKERERWQ